MFAKEDRVPIGSSASTGRHMRTESSLWKRTWRLGASMRRHGVCDSSSNNNQVVCFRLNGDVHGLLLDFYVKMSTGTFFGKTKKTHVI